jgi:hypothetical protein
MDEPHLLASDRVPRLPQGELDPFAQQIRDFRHGVERDGRIFGIQQTVHARPARFQLLGDSSTPPVIEPGNHLHDRTFRTTCSVLPPRHLH